MALYTFPEGLIMDVNDAFLKVFGFKRDDITGKSITDLKIFSDSKTLYMMVNELKSKGITLEIDNLQDQSNEHIHEWIEAHLEHREVYTYDVSTLPEGLLKTILEKQNIKSVLIIPMWSGKELIGFVGFEFVKRNHSYSEREKQILSIFAELLVNVQNQVNNRKMLRLAKPIQCDKLEKVCINI